jgi:DNA-binding SARP family transcriptional activator
VPSLNAAIPHRLRTLGALALTAPDGAPVAAHRRELLLLAYLAGHPAGTATRSALATLLWEDRDDRRARASLRQAIFRMRAALPGVLDLDGETVALAPGRLWTDAGELVRLAGEGALDAAIACWGGDFLAGEDPPGASALREWATGERARLRSVYLGVLERRIAQAEAAGAWADAVVAAGRAAALDPLDAAAGGRLASAMRRAGDPAGALAQLDALAARRRSELSTGLPPRLTALAEELKGELAAREAEAARAALRGAADARAGARRGTPAAAAVADGASGAALEAGRARLLAAWRHVASGADPVLVTGPAASGRTRLLAELQAAAAADGAVVLAARGYVADREVPWATARPLLAPLADAPGLAGVAPTALARLATVVPAVRDAFPALPAVVADDWTVLDAARAAVEEVATEVPVLIVVDDLPRADAMTRQLVLALARRLPVAGVCVAAAARDDELAAMAEGAALLDVPTLHRVALAPPAVADPTPAPTAAAAARPPRPWRGRRARVAVAAVLGALVLGGGAALRAVRGSADGLDATLVAVAPFDVADADLGLWRNGLVDVLARRLDGAGPLRTVPPTTVIRRFEGRGDPASAASLGAQTGAGLVVYGGIIHAGRDSVQLEARLYDARRREVVGEVRVRDALAAMDRAIDALGIGLIAELARTHPMGAVRTAGISAASLPALRAFLTAEQQYRDGAFEAAGASARRALTLDSAFALAQHRLGTLLLYDDAMETGAHHLMAAAVRMHRNRQNGATGVGLSPRDSTVLSLDSLRGACDARGHPPARRGAAGGAGRTVPGAAAPGAPRHAGRPGAAPGPRRGAGRDGGHGAKRARRAVRRVRTGDRRRLGVLPHLRVGGGDRPVHAPPR